MIQLRRGRQGLATSLLGQVTWKRSNVRGLLGLHPQPTKGAVARVSHVSPSGRMRAIIRVQGRLAKLCSVAKRSDKAGWRCLIQPSAQHSVSTGAGPGQAGISIKHVRKALCQPQGALPLHKHHLQSPAPTASILPCTTRQEEDVCPRSAIRRRVLANPSRRFIPTTNHFQKGQRI